MAGSGQGRGRGGGRGRSGGRSTRADTPFTRAKKSGAPVGRAGAKAKAKSASSAAGRQRAAAKGAAPAARRPSGDSGAPRRTGPKGLGGDRVEGRQAVRELLLAGRRRVKEVVLSAGMEPADILDDIIDLADELKVPLREVSRTKFDASARTEAPQGVYAEAAPLPEHDLEDLLRPRDGGQPFLIALDGVTDPGNLGALLRTAECAGVSGVVLPRHRAVHVTPTVTKSAAGAVEFLPMTLVGGLPTAITRMQDAGVWVVGLDETGDDRLDGLDLSQPVCLVLGAEGRGLSRLVRQRCDAVAGIPLRGRLNSLNVAAAGAVACFEVARQRT
ncbi:23S rRNA (guanosine(2251)-2'-O)-methyltransferase RlmB [Actinomarinicola tropica]|uniref:23S rRNA (Guanosine(2251)-2'-O)-methyltransferase RlmB n=1 Tax=Actinomarinicola tropica TaxID=2789776 RepID=A0A5Q2RKW4_9ACTN|nr:23S rRNA (guanosine(2251)-2'-O)-methyltransferase RlmB [Actinomarinicola tropica]QGG96473.1 23S rRNA (guanosine(2251)-2'-O)-methyltransferase RlmB [Actinomarinicola tropica]